MPDYNPTTFDPLKRAKAAADARFGPGSRWLQTWSVCVLTSLMALVVVATCATQANATVVISAAYLPVGLATLAAFVRELRQRKRRSGLIDELWQVYTAEVTHARTEPRAHHSLLPLVRPRSA